MKKLTFTTRRAFSFLLLLFLFFVQGCKKDRYNFANTTQDLLKKQLIDERSIKDWIGKNPASKFLTLDWNNARQGVLKGKRVVRIPIINNDNITGLIRSGAFNAGGQDLLTLGERTKSPKPGSNVNYDYQHPPELFFIQGSKEDKLYSYLLNFIPDNKGGEGKGPWNGKLYEWNLTGDTIFVQHVENNVLKEAYGLKLGKDPQVDNLESALKNSKLQSLSGLKDKKVSNFWKFLQYLPADVVGWLGSLFGLSSYSQNNSGGAGGWRLNIGGSGSGNAASAFSSNVSSGGGAYITSGWPAYNAYIPGVYYGSGGSIVQEDNYQQSGSGDPNATSLEDGFEPYPTTGNGPQVTLNTLTADYVITNLGIGSYEQQNFLRNPNNVDITAALADYIDKLNTISQSDIEFGQWAVGYLNEGQYNGYSNYASLINIIQPNQNIDPTYFGIYFSVQCALIKFEHPEYPQWRVVWEASQEMVHLLLDGVGLIPGVGEVADLTNGAIYAVQGDGVNAALSVTSAIPFVGWFSMGAKYAKKTINLTNGTKTTLKWVKKTGNLVNFGDRAQLRKILNLLPGDVRQAHHIIPWDKQSHDIVQKAAKKNGANPFHMNEALNGIPIDAWRNQPNHNVYNNLVKSKLDALPSNLTPDEAYTELTNILNQAKQAIINNPNTHLNDLIF